MTTLLTGAKMTVVGTPGTSDFVLDVAYADGVTFEAAGITSGANIIYAAYDGTLFEQGEGVYTDIAGVLGLTRSVIALSAQNNGKVTFSSNTIVHAVALTDIGMTNPNFGTISRNMVFDPAFGALRITGNFSDTTIVNRLGFQTAATDSPTWVTAFPTGSSTISGFAAMSDALGGPAYAAAVSVSGGDARLENLQLGSDPGTLSLRVGGARRGWFDNVPGYWRYLVDGTIVAKVGTNVDSTGQPTGRFAAIVYNATNTTNYNGLLVKINSASAIALDVGRDAVGGAYASFLKILGDGTAAFTGAVSGVTPGGSDNSTKFATTEFVNSAVLASSMGITGATLASPVVNAVSQDIASIGSEVHPWLVYRAGSNIYQYVTENTVGIYDTVYGFVFNYDRSVSPHTFNVPGAVSANFLRGDGTGITGIHASQLTYDTTITSTAVTFVTGALGTELHPWSVSRSGPATTYQYVTSTLVGVYDSARGTAYSYDYAAGQLSTPGTFSAGGNGAFGAAKIGGSVSTGFYQDATNLALRIPAGGGAVYFQTASGAATLAMVNAAGLGVGVVPLTTIHANGPVVSVAGGVSITNAVGPAIGIGYDPTGGVGEVFSLHAGVAWKPINFLAASYAFFSNGATLGLYQNQDGSVGVNTYLASANGIYATFFQASGANQFLAPGYMLRSDGTAVYILLTGTQTPTGTWNTFRPFYIMQASGVVHHDNGLVVNGGLVADSIDSSQVARAWVRFAGDGTVLKAYGVSSVTHNSTGDYTIHFSVATPDANYAFVGMAQRAAGVSLTTIEVSEAAGSITTTTLRVLTISQTGSSGFFSDTAATVVIYY